MLRVPNPTRTTIRSPGPAAPGRRRADWSVCSRLAIRIDPTGSRCPSSGSAPSPGASSASPGDVADRSPVLDINRSRLASTCPATHRRVSAGSMRSAAAGTTPPTQLADGRRRPDHARGSTGHPCNRAASASSSRSTLARKRAVSSSQRARASASPVGVRCSQLSHLAQERGPGGRRGSRSVGAFERRAATEQGPQRGPRLLELLDGRCGPSLGLHRRSESSRRGRRVGSSATRSHSSAAAIAAAAASAKSATASSSGLHRFCRTAHRHSKDTSDRKGDDDEYQSS